MAKLNWALLGVMLATASVQTGCQSPTARPTMANHSAILATRNNGYSLLYQLLEQQKDVSLLRFIKREPSDVKQLVKRIATASGAAGKLLKEFARQDASIQLNDFGLPPAETATRAAISASKEKELLGQSGDKFEFSLLLTQTEALSYASHLAGVISANESQPDRARAMAGISKEMEHFYLETFDLLLVKGRSGSF